MRQPFFQTVSVSTQLLNSPLRQVGWTIGFTVWLLGCSSLPAWSSAAASRVGDLEAVSQQAATLTGTVAQPYVETLLPVPQPPLGTDRNDPSRSGGTADPVSSEPLIEIERQIDFAIESHIPVVDPMGRSLPEQTNLLRVTLP